jgi:aminopeptidase N
VAVNSDNTAIAFDLPEALAEGETATLRFRFDGVPGQGVLRVAAGIYTGYFACDWMICLQDKPGDKAEFRLDLFLPQNATSLGIGRALPPLRAADGLFLHRWRSTRAYSPYLYAFAAGQFSRRSIQTDQGEFIYLDATGGEVDLAAQFATTLSIAAFLSHKAGLRLPDGRYAQLLTPGREAQEAASFSLIGKGELSREEENPAEAWIIAHEMAHQWWGNLVTCETWRDFWLNEGIATFMVAAWKEHRFGSDAYLQELEGAARRLEKARGIGFDKPLAWSGNYPSLSIRRAVQYSKGALFLAHLRKMLGDRPFWDGLRAFTRTHAGKTVTSHDFQSAMEQMSGKDLSLTFTQWVYGDPHT